MSKEIFSGSMEELAEEEMLKKIEEVEKGGFEGDVYPDSDDEEADEKRTSSAGLGHHTVQCVPDEGEHRAAHEGLHLFFTNRFEEADAFFQQRQETNPLHSTCYGMVGFIRAIFTFEPDQIQEARKRLAVAHQLAKKHAGYDSTLGSLAKMVSFRKAKPLTQEQLSSRLNVAETKLIDSVLVCLGENVSSLVQGGLGAKWAWHRYDELVSQVHSSDPRSTGQVAVCASDLGGIYYGFGVFNLLLSILPRRVVRLVQLLGFKADRDVGLESLNKVNDLAREHGGGMRAPMASLMLLGYHVMASAFFTVPEELPTHIRLATAILDEEFKRFPDSALFLFNQGRLDRLKGDGTAAVRSFERCMEVNSEWSQLKHLCHYELGWGTMAQGKWGVSREHWEVLERESRWCPAFYVYMKGLCLLRETQDVCKAAAVMGGIPALCKRRFSGKQIPIEAYVNRKVEDHELDTGRGLESVGGSLAVLEILYLWNMMGSLSPQELEKAEAELKGAERKGAQGLGAEVEAMRLLILGNVYSYTGRFVEALAQYRKACEFVPQQEKWVWAHAKYEIGSLLLMSVAHLEQSHRFASLSSALVGEGDVLERATKAKAIFKEVDRFRQDFNFEIRLKFKMQAALKHAGDVKRRLQKDAGATSSNSTSRRWGGS